MSDLEIPKDAFCIICYTGYDESQTLIQLPCNIDHYFHEVCLKEWMEKQKSQCSSCRTPITFELIEENKLKKTAMTNIGDVCKNESASEEIQN